MNLLTFAHRKEAEAFIDHLQFKPIEFHFDGLYKNKSDLLLITGEGSQNASEKVTATISYFKNEIKKVINIGIAGSLTSKIKKNEIVEIRTSYAHHANRLEFKSFTSDSSSTTYDCMTVFERALTLEHRKNLSLLADIIDRELWANASAAQLFKLPFQSIKYISDDLNDEGFCQLVIKESELISQRLLEYYSHQNITKDEITTLSESPSLIANHPQLYFTVTQKRQLNSLLTLLNNTHFSELSFLQREDIKHIIDLDILPKERTRKILELLLLEINPIHGKIKEIFATSISNLIKNDIDVKYDRNFEDKTLTLTFKINSSEMLNSKIRSLANFDFKKIDDLFNGNFDV